MADAITVAVDSHDVRRILRAFADLPTDADTELALAHRRISDTLAAATAAAARASDAQSALLAPTVTARRDPAPGLDASRLVVAGGTQRVGSRRTPAYKILFGAEFGSVRYRQFRPRSRGYWFTAAAEAEQDDALRQWAAAADAVARKWGTAR